MVGLIFYYMKYKSLEKHYRQMSEKDHDEDEMKVVYHEEMQAGNSCKILCTVLCLKGRISRFSACPYTDWPVHAFWHRSRFFIVYEPIVTKLPNFACK